MLMQFVKNHIVEYVWKLCAITIDLRRTETNNVTHIPTLLHCPVKNYLLCRLDAARSPNATVCISHGCRGSREAQRQETPCHQPSEDQTGLR
jgi:hypothetical protein